MLKTLLKCLTGLLAEFEVFWKAVFSAWKLIIFEILAFDGFGHCSQVKGGLAKEVFQLLSRGYFWVRKVASLAPLKVRYFGYEILVN